MRTSLRSAFSFVLVFTFLFEMGRADACPFCGPQGKDATIRNEAVQAKMVLYGQLKNPSLENNQTDFVIEDIVKPHPILGKKRELTLNRYLYLPKDTSSKARFLIFFEVFRGRLDPYRFIAVEKGSKIVEYVTGLLKFQGKSKEERLKFYFDHLEDKELAISMDAFNEFAYADYSEYAGIAKELPPDTIYQWLKDDPAPYRYGLYSSMLGHCSKDRERDVALLKSLVDDPDRSVSAGLDGILASIVMIQPKEGWEYVRGIMKDGERPFTRRYAGLRAVRFLYDLRPDLVDKKKLLEGVSDLLAQPDIADLAIEDLRKRKAWEYTDEVLALAKKDSHDASVIRRSIIRYALSTSNEKAKPFLDEMRKYDRELVEDVKQILELDSRPVKKGGSN